MSSRSSKNTHGFSIDGVDLSTAALPEGWRARLVKVQNVNTAAPTGGPKFAGLCLEKHDLCVAKLYAFREKDRNFVGALLEAQLVDADALVDRLSQLPAEFSEAADRASAWLATSRPVS